MWEQVITSCWISIFIHQVWMLHFSYVVNVYYELTHLPQSIYENNRSAVILPIFFFNHLLQYCDSVQSCAHLYEFGAMMSRSSAIQPRNKQELILCVHDGICSSDKNGYRMHVMMSFVLESSFMWCQNGIGLNVVFLESSVSSLIWWNLMWWWNTLLKHLHMMFDLEIMDSTRYHSLKNWEKWTSKCIFWTMLLLSIIHIPCRRDDSLTN